MPTTTASPARRASRLRVVLADDHHHVLPEIHLALRRRVLPFAGVHVVHWDAHPDLSFAAALPMALVFTPEQLYDALDDSPSGIAEFLLPLVVADHVDRITWIKPHWATQMRANDTMERIAIGRHKHRDRLVVSCPWPHFIDDELYAPESEMEPASIKRWSLSVTEDPQVVVSSLATPWVLDIDLDYFSTWNPFRKQLDAIVTPAVLDALLFVFTKPSYKQLSSLLSPTDRATERQQFLAIWSRIQLLQPSQLGRVVSELVESLERFYDEDDIPRAKASWSTVLHLLVDGEDALRASIYNAAPCLDLPHHEASDEEINTLLGGFQSFLESCVASDRKPALVTIATSVSDRFLPPHHLKDVKTHVLKIVEDTLGPVQLDELEYEHANDGADP